jgi:hypothetical protein
MAEFVRADYIPRRPLGFDLHKHEEVALDEDAEIALQIVPGLSMVNEFLSEDEEKLLIHEVKSLPLEDWNSVHGRRVVRRLRSVKLTLFGILFRFI